MLGRLFVLLMLGMAPVSYAATDSSETLFADTVVRQYNVTFYDSNYEALLEAYYAADSGWLPAKFTDGTITLDSVGVRYKGNSSYTMTGSSPKKPMKIKFDKYNSKQTYSGVQVLNFSNGIGDPSFLREKISYDIAKHYMPSPRASFATISFNGTSIGLYTQVEEADKIYLKRWFTDAKQNLFKAGDDGALLVYLGANPSLYSTSLELKTNTSANDWSGVINFMYVLKNTPDSTFYRVMQNYLSPDNVAAFLAFDMVLSNFDSYVGSGRNFYMYQESTAGFMLFMPWDLNLSFGGFSNSWNVISQDLINVSNLSSRPLNQRVLADTAFRYKYLGWVRKLINEYASTDSVQAEIDRLAPVIRPYVQADSNKFYSSAIFESNLTSDYSLGPAGSIPGLISFSKTRNAALRTQLTNYLPADYQFVAVRDQAKTSQALSLLHSGRTWTLGGVEHLDAYSVDWYQISGRRLGQASFQGSQGSQSFEFPQGIILLNIHSASFSQHFTIVNP